MVVSSQLRPWLTVIGGIIAVFMAIMDIQIVNVVIEPIQTSLGSPIERASWLSSMYLLAEIVALPLAALLLNQLGIRVFATLFTGLFLVGSVLCATAPTFQWLIAARCLQGFAGGSMMALSYVLIIQQIDVTQRARAITLFGAVVSLAPAIGPILAGYLNATLGWRAVFYVNLPIGALALGLILVGLAKATPEPTSKSPRRPVDWFGILTIVPGLAALQFVLEEGYGYSWFASPLITALAVLAIVALTCFVLIERRAAAPLVNLQLLSNPRFLMAAASSALAGAAIYGGFFLVPLYLVEARGLPPLEIANYFIWVCIGSLALLPCITWLTNRFSASLLIACGFALFMLSMLLWGSVAVGAPILIVVIAQFLRGLAGPLILNPLGVLATTSVATEDAPSASVLFNVFRSLGGAIGLALLRNLTSWRQTVEPVEIAFAQTFGILTTALLAMSLFYLWLFRRSGRNKEATT